MGEGLSGLMREATSKSLFKGFCMGKDNIEVNLLQYVNDTIFVGEISWRNVMTIKYILRNFKLVFGLKVNFLKSRFGGIRVENGRVGVVVEFFNCRILSFPYTYLDLPIGANPRKELTWEPIIKKGEKKIGVLETQIPIFFR